VNVDKTWRDDRVASVDRLCINVSDNADLLNPVTPNEHVGVVQITTRTIGHLPAPNNQR
jgi:hypothetical protein